MNGFNPVEAKPIPLPGNHDAARERVQRIKFQRLISRSGSRDASCRRTPPLTCSPLIPDMVASICLLFNRVKYRGEYARGWAWAIIAWALLVSGAQGQQSPTYVNDHADRRDRVPYSMANLERGAGRAERPAITHDARTPTSAGEPAGEGEQVEVPSPQQHRIPVWEQPEEGQIDVHSQNGRVSLVVRDAPLNQVLSMLAQEQQLNLVCSEDVSARISIVLNHVTLEHAISAVLSTAGYTGTRRNEILHVTSLAAGKHVAPQVQGRQFEVFPLDYAAGSDVDQTIKGLLSSVGQSFFTESSSDNLKKSKDIIVVEDVPPYLARIRDYIQQVDRPPRQVLIEVHVLEVELQDKQRHGVNFKHLASLLNNTLEFEIAGAANPDASPAFFARVGGGNLEALIECLKSTTDAKTLASPSVLVVDGQQAKIQIGEQLGYRVTTTTETSTMENVDFLDVGVVLTVTPHVSRESRVLMQVRPKVSSGRINPETELPEEQTKEVETNALLSNREGMVIGGLIQETDSNIQSKIPFLGDLWLLGSLFQKRQLEKNRSEIIVALVPRVLPYAPSRKAHDAFEVHRCQTDLFQGPLERTCRPWASALPDCTQNPTGLWPGKRENWSNSPWGAGIVNEEPMLSGSLSVNDFQETTPEVLGPPENPADRSDHPPPMEQYPENQTPNPLSLDQASEHLPTPSQIGTATRPARPARPEK
ncbi:MAG: type II secretion system protein GspD [Planctomycetota bacterium]